MLAKFHHSLCITGQQNLKGVLPLTHVGTQCVTRIWCPSEASFPGVTAVKGKFKNADLRRKPSITVSKQLNPTEEN